MKPVFAILSVAGLLLLASGTASAQEWTRFRGPNGSGLGKGDNLPAQWTERDYLWRATLPGTGHSSPVLWETKMFVTSSDKAAGKFMVISLNSSNGSILWQKNFPAPLHPLHANNSYAAATPATDARRVFVPRVENGQLLLTALTHAGQPAWEFKAGPFKTEHGLGHSPIVEGNLVVFADDQDFAGRVLALDTETGRLVWQAPRSAGRADYSTPCVVPAGANPACLIFNSHEDGICALDVRTGAQLWRAESELDKRSVSSPIIAAGLITATCGSGGGGNYLVAIRPPSSPAAKPIEAYQIRRAAPYVVTPIAVGEWLFLWSDNGIVSCVQAATGTVHWQERVGGNYFSSPVYADGKLYGTSTVGEVVVLAASKEFKVLGRSSLDEPSHATPAVANGRIYFRTASHVTAVGPKPSAGTVPNPLSRP